MGKRPSLQRMVLGKMDVHMMNNESGPLSFTIHKNKLKMDSSLNVRPENIKILEKSTESSISTIATLF